MQRHTGGAGNPRIVDGNIDFPKVLQSLLNGGLNAVDITNIGLNGQRTTLIRVHAVLQFEQGGKAAADQSYLSACCDKSFGNGFTVTGTRAGDKHHFAAEFLDG